ncbi:unnamed protein product [Mytilus coruscus]|uniref:Uncharacterized protein n=1 Tax=Mytilus coruscus TaxID=42192 RepID=A0A6J8AW38_MYTCO|nr:unnamed protein product [Mytilus coruscus]
MEPIKLLVGVALLVVIISTVHLLRWDRILFRWCSSFLNIPAQVKELTRKWLRLFKRTTGSLTEEEDNFLRMFKLMSNIAPKAVRDKFDHHFPPASLTTTLATNKTNISKNLLKPRFINRKQMDLLYPNTGYTSSTIAPPSLGYDKLQPATEISDGADLARIKHHRNLIAHADKDELSTGEFNSMWACVYEAVLGLGGTGYKTTCDDLSQMNLNKDVLINVRHDLTDFCSETEDQIIYLQADLGIHKLQIEEWKNKERKFVKTPSSKYVSDVLFTENSVTVTGQPGTGKSATIHHVALSMQNGDIKYVIIPCKNPTDIATHYKDGAYQIFVIDDVCGQYVINHSDVEEWIKYKDDIVIILKKGKTKLLATLRLQVFQEDQFKRISIFSKNVCDLSSKTFLLPSKIKLKIAKAYLPGNVVKEIGQSLSRYEYLPLLCLLYPQNPNMNALEYFENPFLMYTKELDEMHAQNIKTKLCALFLLVVFDGCIDERTIRDEKFRQTLELIFDSCKVNRGTPTVSVIDELNTLLGTYLEKRVTQKKDEVVSNSFAYHAIHAKMFDFLCCYFGGKFQKCMLNFSDDNVICCGMQLKSLHENCEAFEIIIEKDNEQYYFDRIVDISKLISHLQLLINDKIKTLLHAQDTNGKTLTYLVCLKGYTDLVQFILERTDDINADHFSTYPPLVGACERGDDIIVQLLLSKGANVNQYDVSNQSPLIMALKGCHNSDKHGDSHSLIIDLLIENGALMDNLEEFYKCLFIQKNVSPLIGASSLGNLRMVKSFIQRGDVLDETDARKFTPLHWTIYNGHYDTAKYFIDVGSNLLVNEQDGRNAFMLACYSGCTEIVKYLLSKEFNVNQVNARGWTPLLYAINGMGEAGNSVMTVTFLISKGADVGANIHEVDKMGWTCVMWAFFMGYTSTAELLISVGSEINEKDMHGNTAILLASKYGNTGNDFSLMSKGANVNINNPYVNVGNAALILAATDSHKNIVDFLITKGADVNAVDKDGNTALILATRLGHTDNVDLLVTKGADVNAVDKDRKTALILAIEYGLKDTVNLLIAKGANVNVADKDGKTALMFEASAGHTDTVDLLLTKGAHVNAADKDGKLLSSTGADINAADKNRKTALLLAAEAEHTDTVDIIINEGADVNASDKDGKTALMFAGLYGHTDTADTIISKGADVVATDKNGTTALLLAADADYAYAEYLLKPLKRDLNTAERSGKIALMLAKSQGHTATVNLLITKGADVNCTNVCGNTALGFAANACHTDTVDLLITKGADVNCADVCGNTALMFAASARHTDTVDLLITKGADVNCADVCGNTALMFAASARHTDTVDLLITKGADVNCADVCGNTALMFAASARHTDTADFLISKGADVSVVNENGMTALSLINRSRRRLSSGETPLIQARLKSTYQKVVHI